MYLERHLLNCLRMNQAQTIFIFVAIALHPLWLYLFVVQLKLGVVGVAVASSITFSKEFILVLIYEHRWLH